MWGYYRQELHKEGLYFFPAWCLEINSHRNRLAVYSNSLYSFIPQVFWRIKCVLFLFSLCIRNKYGNEFRDILVIKILFLPHWRNWNYAIFHLLYLDTRRLELIGLFSFFFLVISFISSLPYLPPSIQLQVATLALPCLWVSTPVCLWLCLFLFSGYSEVTMAISPSLLIIAFAGSFLNAPVISSSDKDDREFLLEKISRLEDDVLQLKQMLLDFMAEGKPRVNRYKLIYL